MMASVLRGLTLTIAFTSCATVWAASTTTLSEKSPERDQLGYSFGYLMGKANSQALNDLDYDRFLQGFKAGYGGTAPALSNDQMLKILNQYKKKNDARALVELQQAGAANLKKGEAFLAENARKTGIKTTASGLQYQVLREGTGQKPTASSRVRVHYEGRLLDGTVFDSSIARDEPVDLPLTGVIKGWQEGVPLMREGSKYRFFIPSRLAYGDTGAGQAIGPYSTLIFDIELIKVL